MRLQHRSYMTPSTAVPLLGYTCSMRRRIIANATATPAPHPVKPMHPRYSRKIPMNLLSTHDKTDLISSLPTTKFDEETSRCNEEHAKRLQCVNTSISTPSLHDWATSRLQRQGIGFRHPIGIAALYSKTCFKMLRCWDTGQCC
jgi:hypothetical protein